jgi:hypothetical protein
MQRTMLVEGWRNWSCGGTNPGHVLLAATLGTSTPDHIHQFNPHSMDSGA